MREQIIAQVSLGIVSGDLQAGEKLPSTREIARRFQIHQNTVSAAYRELAERNLVEFKKGRGVYVRENPAVEVGANSLENLTSRFFQEAAAHGFSDGEIKAHLQQRLTAKPATNFLVVESDAELRKILMAEISDAISRNVAGISFEQAARNHASGDAKVWLMFDKSGEFALYSAAGRGLYSSQSQFRPRFDDRQSASVEKRFDRRRFRLGKFSDAGENVSARRPRRAGNACSALAEPVGLEKRFGIGFADYLRFGDGKRIS